MMFNELSMSAVTAVLDVLEPIAVVHMERLDNLCGQVAPCGEFAQSCECRLDRLMSRPGFFPPVLRMLAAPCIGKSQQHGSPTETSALGPQVSPGLRKTSGIG